MTMKPVAILLIFMFLGWSFRATLWTEVNSYPEPVFEIKDLPPKGQVGFQIKLPNLTNHAKRYSRVSGSCDCAIIGSTDFSIPAGEERILDLMVNTDTISHGQELAITGFNGEVEEIIARLRFTLTEDSPLRLLLLTDCENLDFLPGMEVQLAGKVLNGTGLTKEQLRTIRLSKECQGSLQISSVMPTEVSEGIIEEFVLGVNVLSLEKRWLSMALVEVPILGENIFQRFEIPLEFGGGAYIAKSKDRTDNFDYSFSWNLKNAVRPSFDLENNRGLIIHDTDEGATIRLVEGQGQEKLFFRLAGEAFELPLPTLAEGEEDFLGSSVRVRLNLENKEKPAGQGELPSHSASAKLNLNRKNEESN